MLRVLAFLPWVLMQEGSRLVASLRVVFPLPWRVQEAARVSSEAPAPPLLFMQRFLALALLSAVPSHPSFPVGSGGLFAVSLAHRVTVCLLIHLRPAGVVGGRWAWHLRSYTASGQPGYFPKPHWALQEPGWLMLP